MELATRVFRCPKAPAGWEADWVGPHGVFAPTGPQFCPWCGERLDSHATYFRKITYGTADIAVGDSATKGGN